MLGFLLVMGAYQYALAQTPPAAQPPSTSLPTSVTIDIEKTLQGGGPYLIPLGVPRLVGEEADAGVGQQIRNVLKQDLEVSAWFRIVDPSGYTESVPQSPEVIQYQKWSDLGAVGVIAGQVRNGASNGQLAVQLALHDVPQQHVHNAQTYNGGRDHHRQMAHRFSDQVLGAFMNVHGPVFDTQVVCVTPSKSNRNNKDIVLMDYDGYGVRPVVSDGSLVMAPMLSPDGTLLAYTSYRAGSPNVYLRDVRTGQEERLTPGPGAALPGSWSPDGRYLALNQTVDENTDLYLYDTKTKRWTRLTEDWAIDVSPAFAPDGRRIVFTSDRGGSPQLYITDIQGSAPVRLTYDGRYNTSPSWSPQGETIAFVGRAENRGAVAVNTIRADGSGLQSLTNGGSNYESPSWSPNGRFVMYASMQGGTWRRHMVRDDGQGERLLPTSGPACQALQWVARMAR